MKPFSRVKMIEAFTVSELLVVLVLSSLVMIVAVTFLSMNEQLFALGIRDSYADLASADFLKQLREDISTAETVSVQNNTLVCQKAYRRLEYVFLPNCTLRATDTSNDTIPIVCGDLSFETDPRLGFCTSLFFSLPSVTNEYRCCIHKTYSRAMMFNKKIQ